MKICPIQQNSKTNSYEPAFKKGLYFVSSPDILFNTKANYDHFINGKISKDCAHKFYLHSNIGNESSSHSIILIFSPAFA